MLLALLICAFAINIYMIEYAEPYIYSDISSVPPKFTVIIPGAKVYKNNVSHVVRDRIEAGVSCINAEKAQRILISGDHGRKDYDEVNQMRIFAQDNYGVTEDIIFMDHAGFSTYETMYRARDIFCVDNAIVTSQKFHLARCIYIARKLGLDAVAYQAPEITPFSKRLHISWEVREFFARIKSFYLVHTKAKPKFLGEKIPITEDSRKSYD